MIRDFQEQDVAKREEMKEWHHITQTREHTTSNGRGRRKVTLLFVQNLVNIYLDTAAIIVFHRKAGPPHHIEQFARTTAHIHAHMHMSHIYEHNVLMVSVTVKLLF